MAIRLLKNPEPYWLDLGFGVRLKVRPLTTRIVKTARNQAQRYARDLYQRQADARDVGAEIGDEPDLRSDEARAGLADELVTIELARAGVIAWEGILSADGDETAPVTDETVSDLMQAWPAIADRFLTAYTSPNPDAITEQPKPDSSAVPA